MKNYKLSNHEICVKYDNINIEINHELLNELQSTKCKIDECNLKKWEISKKNHNKYEYIYTSSNQYKNMCIVVPISRSYFKILEILYKFNIFYDNCYISCIAEGPGGFIQCLHDTYSKKKLNIHSIYGITLISDDKRVPFWNTLVTQNKKNTICYCPDKTGDIYKLVNSNYYINLHKNKCFLVTSDGGFDYSENYNNQELSSVKLLFCEVYIALNIQDINGYFIIKMFDLLNIKTIQLLYILYLHYQEIYFYKPDTSRLSNSEKYVVCKGFKGLNGEINKLLIDHYDNNDINLFVPKSFIDDINDYNKMFIKNQIKNINEVIHIIKNNNHIKNKATEKQKKIAKEWCQKYNLEINDNFIF